ncbi:HD domain-containing protein [Paenibacillus sp. N1-5-1-14]|nr:HD domain-containing protein [Paenibacillus radicibacter]
MDAGWTVSEEKAAILSRAHEYVRQELESDASGHDWWHIYRVVQTTKTIAKQERANAFVCELAALMHDLADDKVVASEAEGLTNIQAWLTHNQVDTSTIAEVIEIITTMSFKGGNRPPIRTLEGKVVQDADRLDAIGAMGISRVFAYSGAKNRLIHDPAIRPREQMTTAEYRSGEDTAINHFYEKLLKLKDLMNTNYGRQMAEERHTFMEQYLDQFYAEWEGIK